MNLIKWAVHTSSLPFAAWAAIPRATTHVFSATFRRTFHTTRTRRTKRTLFIYIHKSSEQRPPLFILDPKTQFYFLPVSLAILWMGFLHLKHKREYRERNPSFDPDYRIEGPIHIQFYASLPLKSLSKIWGQFNSITIPLMMRAPLFKLYAFLFNCDLDEALVQDLTKFEHLSDFFNRELKPGLRPIDEHAKIVSPADGQILHLGRITETQKVEQVKGVTYSLPALLGKPVKLQEAPNENHFAEINSIDYSLDRIMGMNGTQGKHVYDHPKNKNLYFCVIYLAPGDYHRFHSPTEWKIEKQRHFAGELFSVSPWIAKSLRNLFVLNERVALLGHWRHGFFSMIPVGATNVGSIRVKFDESLRTNKYHKMRGKYGEFEEKTVSKECVRGEEMGGFMLGSTIVLVFEAEKDFKFSVENGAKVRVGQALGS